MTREDYEMLLLRVCAEKDARGRWYILARESYDDARGNLSLPTEFDTTARYRTKLVYMDHELDWLTYQLSLHLFSLTPEGWRVLTERLIKQNSRFDKSVWRVAVEDKLAGLDPIRRFLR